MSKVLVIGGGLTGMVAARELAKGGQDVTLVERAPSLGGLAASFTINGEPLEKAYHHLFNSDEAILSLIEELGLKDRLEWRESSVGLYRGGKVWPFMSPLDLLRFGACSLVGRIRIGIVSLYIKYTKNWGKLARYTASEWMRRFCGRSAYNAVWGPLLSGKFDRHAEGVSMGWLWARLHIRTNSQSNDQGREELGYIRGGFIHLIQALSDDLQEREVKVETAVSLSNLRQAESGQWVVHDGGVDRTYDCVLFTGSSKGLLRFASGLRWDNDYGAKLRSVDYLGAMCLVFTTEQALGENYWVNVNEEEAPFLVFIRHTKLIEPERYGGQEVYYIGCYTDQESDLFQMPDEDIKALWYDYLVRIFPQFEASQITEDFLFKFQDAQHVVKLGYEDQIPSYETPYSGLYLSNFTQIYPQDRGTNFAVEEGIKVGGRILESLQKDKSC